MRIRKRKVIVGLLAIGFVGSLCWAFWHYWQYRVPYLASANRLSQTLDEAKELGIPLSPEDLRPGVGKDPDDNAAEDYRRATILVSGSGLKLQGGNAFPLGNFVLTGGDAEFLPTAELAIKLSDLPEKALDEAFKKAYCDFELDYQNVIGLDTTTVVDIRPMSFVFGAKAVLAAREGDADTAFAYIYRVNRIRSQLSDDPALARAMLSGVAEVAAPVMFRIVLSILDESPETIRKARALLEQMPVEYSFEFAMSADPYTGLLDIDRIGQEVETSGRRARRRREELLADYVPEKVLKDAYKERYLRFWIDAFKGMRKHPNDPLKAAGEIDKLIMRFNSKTDLPADKYASYATPYNYWNVAISIMRHRGMLALIDGYLTIAEFKNKNGRLPSSSEVRLPEDPYTGQPLIYRPTREGYVLLCDTGTNPSTGGPAAPLGIVYPTLEMVQFGSRGSGLGRRPSSG